MIGSSRISKVLGAQKGIETARRRAEANAQEVFVKWMKTDVKTVQQTKDETTVTLKGTDNTNSEEGKSVETTTTITEAVAQGLIRGLKLLYLKQDSKEDVMYLIYGWSVEDVNLAIEAGEINKNGKGTGDSDNKISRKIEDKTVKSSEADKFF